MYKFKSWMFAGFTAAIGTIAATAADAPSGPAYQIVLRSRHAQASPTRTKEGQTGGGSIVVDQSEPNTVVVTMSGSAVVGSNCRGAAAAIDFKLEQDLDIIPTRAGLRQPRIGLVGRVMGTLQVTDPPECCLLGSKCCDLGLGKSCGTAEQGCATASLTAGGSSLLSISVESSNASCGNELSINHRDGPVEATATAGCYHLSGAFRIAVSQGKGVFHRQFAVADFDAAPQLDGFWADALRPFRAVPRRDFGFKVVLRAIEDPAPVVAAQK